MHLDMCTLKLNTAQIKHLIQCMTTSDLILFWLSAFQWILSVSWVKSHEVTLIPVFLSQPMYPSHQQILSFLLSECLQIPTFCHLYCSRPDHLSHHLLLLNYCGSSNQFCPLCNLFFNNSSRGSLQRWPDCVTLKFKTLQWLLNESHCANEKQSESRILTLAARPCALPSAPSTSCSPVNALLFIHGYLPAPQECALLKYKPRHIKHFKSLFEWNTKGCANWLFSKCWIISIKDWNTCFLFLFLRVFS